MPSSRRAFTVPVSSSGPPFFNRSTTSCCRVDGELKKSEEAVVVALREGLELVVVAAGTGDRQAEKHRAGRRDDVVQFVHPILRFGKLSLAHVIVIARAIPMKAGRDPVFKLRLLQLISGELLGDELPVRLVVVEAADDVIAVPPRVRPIEVVVKAARVCVTSESSQCRPQPP